MAGEGKFLVIGLGVGEGAGLAGWRLDRLTACGLGCRLRAGLLGESLLLLVVIKERIHVLAHADVAGAVMTVPEALQELLVTNELGVEVDGDGLGVIAQGSVSRILLGSAAIADAGPEHPFESPKLGIGSPKSAQAEGRGLVGDFLGSLIERQNGGRGDPVFHG